MGRNCVEEVLRHRPERLEHLYIAESKGHGRAAPDGRRATLESDVRRLDVPVTEVSRADLDALVNSDSHQGVVAQVSSRHLLSLDDLCEFASTEPFVRILALDGVVDPQNFGAILRAAECFGIDAVVWSKNRGAPLGPVVAKASVGASELLQLCPVSNLHQGLETLKKAGVWLAGAVVAPDASPLEKFQFPERCAIVMGSEGDGIQPLVQKALDFRVFIPMYGQVSSLNVSQATSVMLHAAALQHRNMGDVKAS